MKKLTSLISVLLSIVMAIGVLPIAQAQNTPEYNYDNSFWVTLQSQTLHSAQELASLLQVDTCFVMDKQTKEGNVTYQLVAMDEEEPLADAMERVKTIEGVTNVGRNVYAGDYAKKESYLTLNQTAVEIPVGGTATLKLTDAHLVFDEKQETGIMVAMDHKAFSFEQFSDMIAAMGFKDVWGDDAYFYALYEDDYDWAKETQYVILRMWGSNEDDRRHKAESPIGKYLFPIECFYSITPEEALDKLAQVPQITDVRITYDMAPGGIPPQEKWSVENYAVAAVATENGDEDGLFFTATVVGKQVGETVITVQHGYGTRICTATCTVNVVEKVATPTDTPTDIIWGDVTGDTKVDAKDALDVLKYAVNKTTFTAKQMLAAEVSGDENINAKDALEILKYSVEKITEFPIEEAVVTPTDVTPTNQ